MRRIHRPKVAEIERYEGRLSSWRSDTPPQLQPNVVEAVLIEALSFVETKPNSLMSIVRNGHVCH